MPRLYPGHGAGYRKLPPLPADHWALAEWCPACKKVFEAGDITTMVLIGPGDDPEARRLAREGKAYTGVAIVAHWACVTGEDP